MKAEIEAFQKGLNELVPDELMSIFDENELEVSIFLLFLMWEQTYFSQRLTYNFVYSNSVIFSY